MLISYNWLEDYLDIDITPDKLSEIMNMSCMPVEELIEVKADVQGVVSAKILKIVKHPDADKLSYCDVTDGTDEYKIVCGAQNITEGMIVPLARLGAVLPGNFKIKKTKIRGIESQGMMCSAKELGLGDNHNGIMSLSEEKYPLGSEFSPITPDTVFNLEITPNRPDLLCVTGVARFLAAILKIEYKLPSCDVKQSDIDDSIDINSMLKIDNQDSEKCPRYTARIIKGVRVTDSPDWIKQKLLASDIRPINNIVDVTNYILLEMNQPLHAFDHKKIKDSKIIIRTAKKDEKIMALDENEYKPSEEDLLIADSSSPIAIAGVMGGEHYSVDSDTKDIVLESAFFSPRTVRKTSKTLGISSDSSYRFERGIDINNVLNGLNRATQLIIETGGGKASKDPIDNFPGSANTTEVELKFDKVNQVLGSEINSDEIIRIVEAIGCKITSKTDSSLIAEIPGFRVDITADIDLIEDIAQVYGYNNIPSSLPVAAMTLGKEPAINTFKKGLSRVMLGYGFSEAINYSFLNNRLLKDLKAESYAPESPVSLKNPFNEEETHMKTSLIPDLIKNLILNHNNENENIHLYEISNLFSVNSDKEYVQFPYIGAVSSGYIIQPSFNKNDFKSDLYYIKSVVNGIIDSTFTDKEVSYEVSKKYPEFFEFSFDILLNGEILGTGGQLNQDIAYDNKMKNQAFLFEINLEKLFSVSNSKTKYSKISHFPVVKRDLSLLIDSSIPEIKVRDAIKNDYKRLIKSLKLFDLYKGEQVPDGKKSIAYNIIFQSLKKTLSEAEINKIMDNIVTKLKNDFKAELRS